MKQLAVPANSLHFNGHFPRGPGFASTRMSPFWTLWELRVKQVLVKTGAIRRAKLQSNRHHQQTDTQFFTGWMSLQLPNQHVNMSLKGNQCPVEHNIIPQGTFHTTFKNNLIWKSTRRRGKHWPLAVVRRSQKFRPAADPLPGGAGRPKFNQLEMVTTFTSKPSLVSIDERDFELSW